MTTISRSEDRILLSVSKADLVKIHQALSTELRVLEEQDGVLEEQDTEIEQTQQLIWEVLGALGIGPYNS